MIWEEPISASKIVKITHQQTLGLLLSVFWTVTVLPLLRFLTISGVIKLRFKRNLCRWKDITWGYNFYDLRRTYFCLYDSQHRSSTNTSTVTVRFLNCYCLTSTHIFNYIWSYRTPIQAKLVRWKDMTSGYKFYDLRRTQFCI